MTNETNETNETNTPKFTGTTLLPVRERIQRFVDALRSGQYTQGQGYLNIDNKKFCCLGVACEVAIENGLELSVCTSFSGVVSYDNEYTFLPEAARRWYGFATKNPRLTRQERPSLGHSDRRRPTSATAANDGSRLNFCQIADLFEQEYLIDKPTDNEKPEPIPVLPENLNYDNEIEDINDEEEEVPATTEKSIVTTIKTTTTTTITTTYQK